MPRALGPAARQPGGSVQTRSPSGAVAVVVCDGGRQREAHPRRASVRVRRRQQQPRHRPQLRLPRVRRQRDDHPVALVERRERVHRFKPRVIPGVKLGHVEPVVGGVVPRLAARGVGIREPQRHRVGRGPRGPRIALDTAADAVRVTTEIRDPRRGGGCPLGAPAGEAQEGVGGVDHHAEGDDACQPSSPYPRTGLALAAGVVQQATRAPHLVWHKAQTVEKSLSRVSRKRCRIGPGVGWRWSEGTMTSGVIRTFAYCGIKRTGTIEGSREARVWASVSRQ